MEGSDKRTTRPKARQSIAHMPSLARTNGIDKQNATIDLSAARLTQKSGSQISKTRTRGKSLGPGGLEALQEIDGNANKDTSLFQPRSILKPTIPLTPPKNIPTFDELRQRSTRKKSPAKNGTEALLIDFSTPGPIRDGIALTNGTSAPDVFDPFSPVKVVTSANENQHSKVEVEDEEELLRQEQKKKALEQRAARRKSMANRRVSFAPEATLHTWSVMEMVEDSTTSSASNSTRRQSTMTAQQSPPRTAHSPAAIFSASDPLSTSATHSEELLVNASPAHQTDLRQKKPRRSSAVYENGDLSGDEMYSSSPAGDIATESSPIRVEDSIDSDSDTDGDTAMSMDEMTQNTIRSQASNSSTQSSLEERLRQAASQAGTRGIEYDEYGDDVSMDIANDTVTNAFLPWNRVPQQGGDALEDHENANVFSPSKRAQQVQEGVNQDDDDVTQGATMEMTRAVGGIIGSENTVLNLRRKSITSRRRSSAGRRQSIAADSSYGDESMEFTSITGGIISKDQGSDQDEQGEDTSDEDKTMEFTTALGRVQHSHRQDLTQSTITDENEIMDMTAAVGGILAPIEEQTEPQNDTEDEKTMAMEMTRAVGQILSRGSEHTSIGRDMMPEPDDISKEDHTNFGSSLHISGHLIESTPQQLTSVASETGSPSLTRKTRSSGRTRSARVSQTSTPRSLTESTPQKLSSIKVQTTPTKQLTPLPTKSRTPERTPLSVNITHRGASPKKLFQAEIQAKASPASVKKPAGKQQDPLFAQDESTGRQTPRVVLHAPKPHQHLRRRSSGVGIDREGFGSPSVTQLLSRRSSIGDAAPKFTLEPFQGTRIRFEDPKQLEEEVDAERAQDERRESGRFIMEQEANEPQEENVTSQLKDMIESMSPKKTKGSKTKGRKSLAVGSARGLLGKRPMELDDGDDDGGNTPKRLKVVSKEGSPVKKVHLPKPPSKEETTGRLTRAEQKALDVAVNGDQTPALGGSPSGVNAAGSPQPLHRYKDVAQIPAVARPTSFEDKLDNVMGAVDPSIEHPPANKAIAEEDKISLQQFLSMTNIHFIELNTTKRRHTTAQTYIDNTQADGAARSNSTKACFVAAATTMPLLELYQHATKELKSYISTGRKMIRSIESETLAEQPALFREYIEARPDVKLVMDNQFRNGKTNARLQSKEGWYTWRSQLVDGLGAGLRSIQSDMEKDLVNVEKQVKALSSVLPELSQSRDNLVNEVSNVQQQLNDIDSVDYQALKSTRQDLESVDSELNNKLAVLEVLRQQMHDREEALSQAAELKDEMLSQIAEANRVREEHRGWAVKDVLALKTKVETIEKRSGWYLASAEEDPDAMEDFGPALTMKYKDTLRLFFCPAVFEQSNSMRRRSGRNSRSMSGPTAPISLTFLPSHEDDTTATHLPTEQRFFLQLIQSQLHAFSMMPVGAVAAKTILDTASSGWEKGCQISEEIRLLSMTGITRVSIKGDECLSVNLMIMLPGKSRIDIEFTLLATVSSSGDISLSTSVVASPVYGPVTSVLVASKSRKVQIALSKEIGCKNLGEGAWAQAVRGFEEWFSGQTLKQQESQNRAETIESVKSAPTEETAPVGSTTPKSSTPVSSKTPASRRSPLGMKKPTVVQKKIPVPTSRQEKFKTSQREVQVQVEKTQATLPELSKDKENVDPLIQTPGFKPPAITPEMQEAMMQRTPIKRVGALRRSPIH